MADLTYTHLTLVVDRSGSMTAVRDDAEGGLNTLLDEQFAAEGRFTVTVVDFDDVSTTHSRMSTHKPHYTLTPRGTTALYDAVGAEILATGRDLAALEEHERPGTVIFAVVTDGHENSSKEHTLGGVRKAMATQRDVYSWQFHFLGADDAAWQGHKLGVPTIRYHGTGEGTRAGYNMLSSLVTHSRSGGSEQTVRTENTIVSTH